MPRALLIVLDSVGIGGAPDAAAYGDKGANTLGHIAQACASGHLNGRSGPLKLPHLSALGLGLACHMATGTIPTGLESQTLPQNLWGCAVERSKGKDTPSGHWEIMGAPVTFNWGVFSQADPAIPLSLTKALAEQAKLTGTLCNNHASGTSVIDAYGAEHLSSLAPILYTSVDSVLQIAAHEEAFGLERLYATCRIARLLCDPLRIGRVIARPFLGNAKQGFQRTGNRKDYSIPLPSETLLDRLENEGRSVVSVGKIGDIFAHRHTGQEIRAHGNAACLDAALEAMSTLPDGGLVFVNLVDFDSEYGHRRDVAGYAAALERFDTRIPDIKAVLKHGDLALITADHGNDPTWTGTDHTRECVPILGFGPGIQSQNIGRRESFADIGASLAQHLGVKPTVFGMSWFPFSHPWEKVPRRGA
jgi:phosphopentomutase